MSVRTIVGVIVALVAVLFVVATIGTISGGHTSGGCNHIALVNGQPAHPCSVQLH